MIQDSTNSISGLQGLTKSGGGTLRLLGTNTFGGTKEFWYFDGSVVTAVGPSAATVFPFVPATDGSVSAPLTINAGRLEFNVDANLGYALSAIVINGGTLAPLQSSTSSRAIVLASLGNNVIDVGSSGNFSTSGQVTGNALTKNGAGTFGMTNTNNTYTGGTFINAGTVSAAGSTSLGAADSLITFVNSTLALTADTALAHPLLLNSGSATLDTGANTVTFNGNIANVDIISGTGNVIKAGTGKLILGVQANQNAWIGNLVVNQGIVEYRDGGTAGTTAITGLQKTPTTFQAGFWTLADTTRVIFNLPVNNANTAGFNAVNQGMTITSGSATVEVPVATVGVAVNGFSMPANSSRKAPANSRFGSGLATRPAIRTPAGSPSTAAPSVLPTTPMPPPIPIGRWARSPAP